MNSPGNDSPHGLEPAVTVRYPSTQLREPMDGNARAYTVNEPLRRKRGDVSAKQRGTRKVASARGGARAPANDPEGPKFPVRKAGLTRSHGGQSGCHARRTGEGPVRPIQHPMHPHPAARKAGASAPRGSSKGRPASGPLLIDWGRPRHDLDCADLERLVAVPSWERGPCSSAKLA